MIGENSVLASRGGTARVRPGRRNRALRHRQLIPIIKTWII